MALRNQPYMPLYVQDYLTDEKLNECSAATQGVYIKLMCIMHKSEVYGCILLEQKYKQDVKQTKNFASKLVKHLPFPSDLIESALDEMIQEGVIVLNDDILYQKRMVKDNNISLERSKAGKKGGKKTQFALAKVKAKDQANSEYENEYETDNVNTNNIYNDIIEYLNQKAGTKYKPTSKETKVLIKARMNAGFTKDDFISVIDNMAHWLEDPKMISYYRPVTLFGTKFESYLNKKEIKSNTKYSETTRQNIETGKNWLKGGGDE